MCFCGNAALTVPAPHCGHCAPKLARSWPCSLCAEVMIDCGKSLLHTKLGSNHVYFAAMLHSLFVHHIVATVPQNWLGLGHAVFVQKSWLDCGKSLITHKTGGLTTGFCGNAALTVCAPHCGHCAPKLARSWPCSFCAEVMIGLWVNHYYTQNWGLTVCFLRQCCTHTLCPTLWPLCPKTGSVWPCSFCAESWLDCGK